MLPSPYGGNPAERAGLRSGRWRGSKLKPDAEIVLFDDIVVFLERQTSRAQEKPGKIHGRMFEYHACENFLERRADKRKMRLLWAVDTEYTKKAVREAKVDHPTKDLDEFKMDEGTTLRMPVHVGSPVWVAGQIRHRITRHLSSEAS